MATPQAAAELKNALDGQKLRILSGMEGLLEAAQHEQADTVVTAMVGMLGARRWPRSAEKSASPLPTRRRWSAPARWSCRLPGNTAQRLSR